MHCRCRITLRSWKSTPLIFGPGTGGRTHCFTLGNKKGFKCQIIPFILHLYKKVFGSRYCTYYFLFMTTMHIAAMNETTEKVETKIQNGLSLWRSKIKQFQLLEELFAPLVENQRWRKELLRLTVRDLQVGSVAPLTPGAVVQPTAHLYNVNHPGTDAIKAEMGLCTWHVLLEKQKMSSKIFSSNGF